MQHRGVGTIRWAASDGADGKNGLIVLRSEWALNTQYRNDEAESGEIRYLNVAMVRDNTLASGWKAFKCLRTHVSNAGNAPGNTEYWEEFPVNVSSIFTSLIIAKDARIEFFTNNELRILDADNNVTAGFSGAGSGSTGYRLWIGAATGEDAPTRFAEDGSGRLAGGGIEWDEIGNIKYMGGMSSPFILAGGAVDVDFGNNFYTYRSLASLSVSIIPCSSEVNGKTIRIHCIRRGASLRPEIANGFYENGATLNEIQLDQGEAIEMIGVCMDEQFHSWEVIARYKCRPYDQ